MGQVGWVRLLGPVEVGHGGAPLGVGGPIARLLLVQLVLAEGHSIPDDQAVDAVWGEWPPESVAAALRVHIARLRAAIAVLGWTVERQHHGYALGAGPAQLDVTDLAEAEAEASAATDPTAALAAAERGLALWRGPSLTDVRRLPLGGRLAASYDRRREGLVDRRLEVLLQMGRAQELLAPLERLVGDDPLNERRWGLLATALYRSGQPAEALRALREARRALGDGAGLEPGPALCALERSILDHEVGDQVVAAPSLAVPTRTRPRVPGELESQAPARLIGRDGELATLMGALAGVAERRCSAVVRVHGESGVGKSALVAHFARRALEADSASLYGWADQDAPLPLGPLAVPLATLIEASPTLQSGPAHRVLGRLLGWGDMGGTARRRSEPAEPAIERARVLAAVRSVFMSAVQEQPLVLVLDDVQWADELAVAAIRNIARHPVPSPLLALVVERSGFTTTAGRGITDLAVGPLRAEHVARWADRSETESWTQRALELTGGLPLLLESVIDGVGAGLDLDELPRSIGRALLLDRSADLSPGALDALTVGGVLGISFRFDDVARIAGGDELDLLEGLDAANRAGLVEFDRTDPEVFRFTHDLLRLAFVDRLSPLHRMQLHAQVLQGITGLTPLAALHHAREAGRFVDGASLAGLAIPAARELLDSYGFDAARRILEAALETTDPAPSAVRRATLLTLLARTRVASGDAAGARAHLDEALGLATDTDDPEIVAEAVVAEASLGHGYTPDPHASARLERLMAQLPAASRHLRFAVLRQLVFTHLDAGRIEEGAAVLHRASSIARELGTTVAEAALLSLEHWRWESSGDPARRKATVERAEQLAAMDPDPILRTRMLSMSLIERLHEGDGAAADRVAEELSTVGAACGEPHVEWLGMAARFSRPLLAGQLTEAHEVAERARARGEEIGLEGVATAYAAQLFTLGWVTGDLHAFTAPIEVLGVSGPDLVWRAARALALAVSARPDEAAAELARLRPDIAAGGASWLNFVGVVLAVETASMVGDIEIMDVARPVLGRRRSDHVVLGTGALDLGPVDRYLALVVRHLGHDREAVELLRAVAAEQRSGWIWQVRAAVDLARTGDGSASSDAVVAAAGAAWRWLLATGAVVRPLGPEHRASPGPTAAG
ncbi:MAG: BTAD domain-containing putative transcriptional regulator [Acidimicrobiales bacterium]